MSEPVRVTAVNGIAEVHRGDDLAALLDEGLRHSGIDLMDGDIVVVSSKIASKALGLVSDATNKDALVASQTCSVVAERAVDGRVTRVVHSVAGPVMAAAGVDGSNTGERGGWLLLPADPDAVCRDLHAALTGRHGVRLGVVLSDTAGRPWRIGQTDFALGAHGVAVAEDLRGGRDADGRPLHVTTRAVADEIAAAADLVKGKASRVPAAVVRGLAHLVTGAGSGTAGAARLVRTGPGDWFALGRVEAVRAALGVEPGSADSEAVGIPPATPGTQDEAVRRAVALALHGVPDGRADIGDASVRLEADGPYGLGRLLARFEVALASESLVGRAGLPSADGRAVEVSLEPL
ncbi:MAG: coenzyme F420-0:L-glutamate ligase [Intrasporangium sp.]|uniref:coenzyme F420-0:L-glutamate ligase n=1 Tax=Intrasporangium sp. TaxID=1925024 RepID=UPI0026478002|nr:coenzyme F420-0:L-glutamate ligase [Intrasporangium sp.]MDN5798042.1 coenzyme F420-0:L-glutamate ligase [Intrasporangium sp.]